ncbi:cytochrome c-type biogenesis protein [Dokdonella sp.]|uniref:cytochrome c-type biogenesis protein n=1 Tax=Dokdonella sp. TaxID=2291710 RepID=UPI0031BCC846|nr:cytochrome c-type biogenesis protein CcmH [Dokdonella sp.]
MKPVQWASLLLAALVALVSLTSLAAVDPLPFKDRAEEVRFQNLTRQLRCLVCQNESLNDSSAPLAADLRRDVFEQMRAGKSDAEIKAWLTDRYSDFVLYEPPLRGGTLLLWFGPLVALLIGAGVVVTIVRKRATGVRAGPPPDTGEDDW